MRIGVDGGCWTNRRGYGRFLRELVAGLAAVDDANEYVVFLDNSADRDEIWPARFEPRFVRLGESVGDAAGASSARRPLDLLRMSWAAARERLDLFFFPSVFSYFPLFRPVKTLVGVHDTIAEDHPELTFDSKGNERFWRAKVRAALFQADLCLTVSEHSRRGIERVYGFPGQKIRVVMEAASPVFTAPPTPVEKEDFLLAVGGISPNKNLARLIEAFAGLTNRTPDTRLVLVGDYEGDRFKSSYGELRELIGRLGVDDRVEFAGFVSDADLTELYRRTRLFVMPSLDEGFGLPALEAMACGAPAALSSGHALEEVAAGAALLFDPLRVDAIRSTIDRALADPTLTASLATRSLARASGFSWENTARDVVKVFEETGR